MLTNTYLPTNLLLAVTCNDVSHGIDIRVHILLLSNQCCIPTATHQQYTDTHFSTVADKLRNALYHLTIDNQCLCTL